MWRSPGAFAKTETVIRTIKDRITEFKWVSICNLVIDEQESNEDQSEKRNGDKE